MLVFVKVESEKKGNEKERVRKRSKERAKAREKETEERDRETLETEKKRIEGKEKDKEREKSFKENDFFLSLLPIETFPIESRIYSQFIDGLEQRNTSLTAYRERNATSVSNCSIDVEYLFSLFFRFFCSS